MLYPLGYDVIAERLEHDLYLYPLDQNCRSRVRVPVRKVQPQYGQDILRAVDYALRTLDGVAETS